MINPQRGLPKPDQQVQTLKKRRGVETYKFFQNWLRVLFQCHEFAFIVYGGKIQLTGWGEKGGDFRRRTRGVSQGGFRGKKQGGLILTRATGKAVYQ